jgi:hypothetical protein
MSNSTIYKCDHRPEQFGESNVTWNERGLAIGTLLAPCRKCGETLIWKVEAE